MINRSLPTTFYGDDTRWFVATVVNTVPPPSLEGRIKIRIHGVHNLYTGEIPERDLPWAQVALPTTEGGLSGIGRNVGIVPGSFVYGIFMDGKGSQIPLVLGSMPRIELPTIVQTRSPQNQDSFKYDQEKLINQVVEELVEDDLRSGDADKRRNQAAKFFLDNGYKLMHACAIAGCLQARSNFVLFSETDEGAQGIAKWNNISEIGRFKDLIEFAKIYEPSSNWKKMSVQLQFVLFELRNKFTLANYKLVKTEFIEDAVDSFSKYYFKESTAQGALELAEKAYDEALAE